MNVFAVEPDPITIGLIGDSTVADTYGWGPAFATRFIQRTTVLNFAKNGATLQSLSGKLDELLELHPDIVLIQFGHNDQKRYGPDAYLEKLESYIERVLRANAKPVVLSSVTRRRFGDDGKILFAEQGLKANLSVYAKTAREAARKHGVPFIDLHSISVEHHNRIGREASAAYDFNENDKTYFSEYGAKVTANLILQELKVAALELAPYLTR